MWLLYLIAVVLGGGSLLVQMLAGGDHGDPGHGLDHGDATHPDGPGLLSTRSVIYAVFTFGFVGGLLPIPELRSRVPLEPPVFDAYIHRLHGERLIHLLSHVDGGQPPADVRASCIVHSGGALLYWVRWL